MNRTEELNEVQRNRYYEIKDISLRLHPEIGKDNVKSELAEHLFMYYARNGVLPEPQEPMKNTSVDVKEVDEVIKPMSNISVSSV